MADRKQQTGFIDAVALVFCRLWLAGRSPWAPGTCGSAVAVILAPFCFLPFYWPWRLLLLAGIFVLGALASGRVEKKLGRKDPGEVVIDELLGQWLVFLPFADASPLLLALGFGFFRLFDITKPWPVNLAEKKFPEGWGVMADDGVAGIYAMLCLLVLTCFFQL